MPNEKLIALAAELSDIRVELSARDHRAATGTEVAADERTGIVYITVLAPPDKDETKWGVVAYWKKGTLELLADEIQEIEGEIQRAKEWHDIFEVWDKRRKEWKASYDFNDRNRDLSRKQSELNRQAVRSKINDLRTWLYEYVPKFVDEIYDKYKRGTFRTEPCITAAYVRGFLDPGQGGELVQEYRELWEELSYSQQIGMVTNILEALHRRGELGRSIGPGRGGRDTKCYEPKNYGM